MAKTVVLGVTGCIAAYKACEVVRGLQRAGVQVRVAMTEAATHFVGPLTFHALTGQPVATGFFGDPGHDAACTDPIPHITLAKEADLLLIAPCTGDMLAKMANGIAEDVVSSTALAATSPMLVAPAMNVHMYEAAATQRNLETLRQRGVHVVEADEGYLACGDTGKGRLADPEAIVQAALELLQVRQDLADRKVLVTAGPTREPIDPARCITNRSSGKMGFALARAAAERGAQVTLVTGPVALADPDGMETVHVETALEMLDAVEARFDDSDMALFSAAVCDGRPKEPSDRKLKKGADDQALAAIELVENPDILATMGARKRPGQAVVGFAAETEDLEANGRRKLEAKGADLIVANLVSEGRGFGADRNEALLVTAHDAELLPLMDKADLAHAILDRVVALQGASR